MLKIGLTFHYWGGRSSGSCVLCTSASGACPAGYFSDISECTTQLQLPPTCRSCHFANPNAVSPLSNGGTSAYGCMGVCGVGWHSVDNSTGQYLSQGVGANGTNLKCVACVWNDGRTCASEGCPHTYYRNLQVGNGQLGSCLPCITSSTCRAGTYATPCTGNGTANAVCIACPPLHYSQMYVTTADQIDRYGYLVTPTMGDCPWACAHNYYRDDSGKCVSCISNVGYARAGFLYSIWNAAAQVPWWPIETTPSSLVQHQDVGGKWQLAG